MYNTLETIVWLAEEGRNSEVVEMTMAFTGFLRISLSRGADYITVEREEQHVANYLQIQSVRYGASCGIRLILILRCTSGIC